MSSSSPCELPGLGERVLLFLFRPGPQAHALRSLYLRWLGDEERERLLRYRFDCHRDEYLHGRALARYVLSSYLGIEPGALRFGHNRYGKPHLEPGCGLHFNLSHTRGINMLALSRQGPVGVDIEYADPARAGEDISQRYFTAQEHRRLLRAAPEDRAFSFFSTWTLKESFVKAVGQGLSLPLSSFAYELEGEHLQLSLSAEVPAQGPWHSELLRVQPELLCAWTVGAAGGRPPSAVFDMVPAAGFAPWKADVLANGSL